MKTSYLFKRLTLLLSAKLLGPACHEGTRSSSTKNCKVAHSAKALENQCTPHTISLEDKYLSIYEFAIDVR